MTSLTSVRLHDGTEVTCVRKLEAMVLDEHVDGYFRHGIDVGPGAVVVDAGANIGLFGVRVLGRCGGDATVLAFEPAPPTFAALAGNAARHDGSRFKAFQCGLSSRAGEAELTYYPRSPAMSTAHPEVYDEDVDLLPRGVVGSVRRAPAGMRWARLLPEPICRFIAWHLRGRAQRFRCELRTLSEVIREQGLSRIDLLKVDVEGEELEVLRGIDAAHWPLVRQAVVEVHDRDGRLDAVRALLRRNGLDRQHIDQEDAFRGVPLYNVYAARTS
jgi:FkbM family methyltransferase